MKLIGKQTLLGIIFCTIISYLSILISQLQFFINIGISALVIVIIFGMIVGNIILGKIKSHVESGINFTKHYFLRAGIILYGFRLTLTQIAEVGTKGVLIDALMVTLTFLLTYLLAIKIFKIDPETSALIGSGASICGAAAVLATSPVVSKDPNKVAVAMATVVIFGTIAIFVYPAIFHLLQANNISFLDEYKFGVYVGSSVHEVAQVVAIGNAISLSAENASVIEKMIRVMMLAPFLLILSYFWRRTKDSTSRKTKIIIPWFAIWFIVVICFNTLNLLPVNLVKVIVDIDGFLLTMAMGALGLTTSVSAIKNAGIKPFLLGLLIFVWLIVGGFFINILIQS